MATKKTDWFSLYTDGASRGNPGQSGAGIVIIDPEGQPVVQKFQYLGIKTNNEAEYLALILGLKEACQRGIKYLQIYMDSELLCNQLKGRYKVKAKNLHPLFRQTQAILKNFSYRIEHIKREYNKLADKLANQAIDEELKQVDGRS